MDRRKLLLVAAVVVAALGAGLVFVYAQGAEDRARDDIATTRVLVAVQEIQAGESAADAANQEKLLLKDVPNDQLLEGHVDQGEALADTVALTTIYPGEQVTTNKFGNIGALEGRSTLPIPEGQTAITLRLSDTGRVSSFTQPGSRVAVYFAPDPAQLGGSQAAPSDGFAAVTPACVIDDNLLVLGVGTEAVDEQTDPAAEEAEAAADDDVALITVAVDSKQASTLVGFQIAAERENSTLLSFALRNGDSQVQNTRVCDDFLKGLDKQLELAPVQGENANG
ncbi:Flp pilus assembly protein CpaB [Nocardioides litoris]|uniref:Flp pilus assembly protein CpaB n=1 Tax=Nocardioides litoris TaxID=1926648 RepID=UPI00147691A3|nr:RcpC/CpaB family pilus assembly protein [Nocardioides litoris]